jgi:hypothetical protein
MRINLVLLACASAFGLAACKSEPIARETVSTYAACAHVREAVKTCQLISNQWVCPVVLTKGSAGVPGVDPFTLRAKADASVVVVWSVADDSGARFHVEDGPTWIGASQADLGAISDPGPTADPSGLGASSPQPQPYYRIRLTTTPTTTSQSLKYSIKFHDVSGNEVVCDPFINNSGG